MELSNEQKQQVNIAVAKDMGYTVAKHKSPLTSANTGRYSAGTWIPGHRFDIFNPDNTTDLNKAMEL